MDKQTFATEHGKICSKKNGLGARRTRYTREKCGGNLFDFLTKFNIPLDIYHNQKKKAEESNKAQD
tara:strand:+ start:206 stop:403 length:198 start_codon:yes stop_codon:yes gene_type:complete